jgi:hypothetical protein
MNNANRPTAASATENDVLKNYIILLSAGEMSALNVEIRTTASVDQESQFG